MREEAERAEAVVEGDDDRTLGGEVLAVIPGHAAGAAGEAAAVDPDHDRPLVAGALRAGPDIAYRQSSLRAGSRGGAARLAPARVRRHGAAASGTARRPCTARRSSALRTPSHAPPAAVRATGFRRAAARQRNALEHVHRGLSSPGRARRQTGFNVHLLRDHRGSSSRSPPQWFRLSAERDSRLLHFRYLHLVYLHRHLHRSEGVNPSILLPAVSGYPTPCRDGAAILARP